MQLTFTKTKLAKLITAAAHGISHRDHFLHHNRLRFDLTDDGVLSVRGVISIGGDSVRGLALMHTVRAEGFAGGAAEFSLPVREVQTFLRGLPARSEVTVTCPEATAAVTITSGDAKIDIRPAPHLWQPLAHDSADAPRQFTMPAQEFRRGLEMIAPSMAKDDVRYYLNGASITPEADRRMTLAATDGHRLTQTPVTPQVSSGFGGDGAKTFLLPRAAVIKLVKACNADGQVCFNVAADTFEAVIDAAAAVVTGQLIDGKWPEFAGVFDAPADISVMVNREDLISILRGFTAIRKDAPTKITAGGGEAEFKFFSEDQDANAKAAPATLACSYAGEIVEAGYRGDYMLDAMKTMRGENVDLALRKKDGVSFIRESDDAETMRIIMPLRV